MIKDKDKTWKRGSQRALLQQSGMTLIEVVVAIAIMAVIATASFQALDVTSNAAEASEKHLDRIERIDRIWVLMDNDLRNVIPKEVQSTRDEKLPPMVVASGQDYWLTFLRGGKPNPLNFPRTELARVGYRFQENALWRDSWIDPSNPDVDLARQQKLLDDVESIEAKVLSPSASSISDGPWLEDWPASGADGETGLPYAVEITLTLTGRGELKRLFSLPPERESKKP